MSDLTRDRLEEGIRRERAGLHELALRLFQEAEGLAGDAAERAEALWRQSYALRATCRWDDAIDAARRGAAVAEAAHDRRQLAEALNAEALVYLSRGVFEQAEPLLRRMLEFADDRRLRGIALQNLGSIAAQTGRLAEAERHFAESYGCFNSVGYQRGEVTALNNQARAALDRGDAARAREILPRAIALAADLQERDLEALAMLNYGEALLAQAEYEQAELMASTALGFYTSAGDAWRRIESLQLLGDINARQGDVEPARACYAQGLSIALDLGARVEIASLQRRIRALPASRP
ncbi:MAG: tetratricopeptide repeat protein [Gemmatimonadaceae bacterium]